MGHWTNSLHRYIYIYVLPCPALAICAGLFILHSIVYKDRQGKVRKARKREMVFFLIMEVGIHTYMYIHTYTYKI